MARERMLKALHKRWLNLLVAHLVLEEVKALIIPSTLHMEQGRRQSAATMHLRRDLWRAL
jgi:hypothetical protein